MEPEPNLPIVAPGPRRDRTCWCSVMLMLLMFLAVVLLFGLIFLTQHRGM